MTAIAHHLPDDLLIRHAAGTLHEAFALVIATHVTLCDDCRARLSAFEAVGGAVLEGTQGVAMAEGSLAAVLQRLTGGPQDPASGAAPARPASLPDAAPGLPPDLPVPLAAYAADARVRWRPLGLGVRQALLPVARGARARLLHIPPGRAMPAHGHRGLELTLVLQGAFSDAGGRFGPGDIEVADTATNHLPVAEAGPPCLCIAATDAPLRFAGLLPRLVQRLARI